LPKDRRRAKGEGGIRKRVDGRWEGTIELGWQDGKRRRKSVFGRTRAEVAQKLAKAKVKSDRGLPQGDERRTVATVLDRWLEGRRLAGKAAATLDNYEWAIDKHLKPSLGRIRLVQLTPEDVDDMLRRRARDGASKSTLVRIRSVLSMALQEAVSRDHVARNVAELAQMPAAPKKVSRSLTVEQAKALLDAASGDRLEAAYVTMLMLGLRPGEALGLRWEDIDLKEGVVRVRQALRRGHDSRLELGALKTAGSRRTLAAPGPVLDALRAHRRRQLEERLRAGVHWRDNGLVFTTEIGTVIDPRNFRRVFASVCRRAGLGDDWHPHELRHSAVSLLSAAGVREEDVADVVGHVTTRMTHQVYRHQVTPTVDAGRDAMEKLFGTIGGQIGGQPGAAGQPAD
jgi:integrase